MTKLDILELIFDDSDSPYSISSFIMDGIVKGCKDCNKNKVCMEYGDSCTKCIFTNAYWRSQLYKDELEHVFKSVSKLNSIYELGVDAGYQERIKQEAERENEEIKKNSVEVFNNGGSVQTPY